MKVFTGTIIPKPSTKFFVAGILMLLFSQNIFAQPKPAYEIFTEDGKKVNYGKMLSKCSNAEVILFGEYHDNPISHWLEISLATDLSDRVPIALGAEMLEADDQMNVNKYLMGKLNRKALDSLVRLWPNYQTDYEPLVELAKLRKLKFIATNVPRRFASKVYKEGFESLDELSDEEKSWIAPLPIFYDANAPGYLKMHQEMGGHGGDNLPKAQAIKDATMAYFILENLNPNGSFLHFNGTYHSNNYDGIFAYLKRVKPYLKILTIATVEQKSVSKLEAENVKLADFIIVIDEKMTKTY